MKNIINHFKQHHKKYLFGIFGGFALVKTLLVFLTGFGIGVTTYYYSTFADQTSGCVMTGQYYTGQYQAGCYETGGYMTGAYTTGCYLTGGYRTGGYLDDEGQLTGQEYTGEYQTGCYETGDYLTGGYTTGCYLTGGYRTGGTLSCTSGTNDQDDLLTGGDGICGTGDIHLVAPVSGALLRGTIPLQISYLTTDCVSTPLTIQLRDHNQQWVSIATLSSGVTSTTFNSLLLSGITNASGVVTSGLYSVLGSGLYLYTGIANGSYSNFRTGYQLRIVNGQNILTTGGIFTIDNKAPTLTGIQLTSSAAVSGHVTLGNILQLSFIASEQLVNVQVTIAGSAATFTSTDRPLYNYTQTLTSSNTQGPIMYTITYADTAGNTGSVSGTGLLTFDSQAPVISGLNLTGTITGLTLSFSTNEPAVSLFQYQNAGGAVANFSGTTYQTGTSYVFSGLQANILYAFRLSAHDIIGNVVNYSGSFLIDSSGAISLDYNQVSNVVGTGDLIGSGNTLKDEIIKFNQCKDALSYKPITLGIDRNNYVLQMPNFEKSDVKTIVNAFVLFILDKIQKHVTLTNGEITDITNKFNNFLIILKLLRDDDNSCKQNLSNYHITQFISVMNEYKITLQ